MAKQQRKWFAPEQLSQPYHDEMHLQSYHQKHKFVTKSNAIKNPSRNNFARKNRAASTEGRHVKFKNHTYVQHPSSIEPLLQPTSSAHAYTPPEYYYIVNATEPPTLEQIAAERERIRVEFFSTYDVMTGVRIATTLGGFFGLMVFLVIYKSRGERIETMKALKDPKIAAVAAAVMQEEEDRELQEALEATGLAIYPDDYIEPYPYRSRTRMMSLGNVSAPPTMNQYGRFSSIGGYNSLLTPTRRRFSYAGSYRKSNSVESSRVFSAYPIDESFDYYMESDGEEADDEFDQITSSNDVDVQVQRPQFSIPKSPQRARELRRRCSNITCCSSESSYLERRCSAITLGLSPLPAISSRCPSTANIWDFVHQHNEQALYIPPDIQLIQATPRVSPSSTNDQKSYYCDNSSGGALTANRRWRKSAQRRRSIDQDSFDSTSTFPERNRRFCYDEIEEEDLAETTVLAQQINKLGLETRCLDDAMLKYTLQNSFQTNLLSNRRAPLASISSLKISSIDYQDSDLRSPISDSLFEETYADTDEDLEPFSLDSDDGMESRKYGKNGKTVVARIERTEIDASTSILNKSIAMQTSFTGLNMDTIDMNQETICEIDEIGPQAQQKTDRTCYGSTIASAENVSKSLLRMGDAGGSSSSGNGSVNNNTNKYSRSTGNVTQECASKLGKNQFLSEPLNLHFRTTFEVGKVNPTKLHECNNKSDTSMQNMPLKTNYCNSSSSTRSSSSCHSTT